MAYKRMGHLTIQRRLCHAWHGKYSGYEAIFDFEGNILEGELPNRAVSFVKEWIALHKEELDINWKKARSGQPLDYIAPLE